MRKKTDVLWRLGVGKGAGFVVGLAGFFTIPVLWPEADPWFRWGILLWYTTLGVMIGALGVFDRHPLLRFRMAWWFRGLVFGAWLNLVLALIAYEKLAVLLADYGAFASPYWMVAEGAVFGLIIDGLATRFGGEGPVG